MHVVFQGTHNVQGTWGSISGRDAAKLRYSYSEPHKDSGKMMMEECDRLWIFCGVAKKSLSNKER